MPKPIALCIEDLETANKDKRYLQCVAISGAEPGITMDADGKVFWQSPQSAAIEFWVSQDEQLMLVRLDGAPPVKVSRAGRFLDAPYQKPVVLLDKDTIQVEKRTFCIHQHGISPAVSPPSYLLTQEKRPKQTAAAIAAFALATVTGLTPTIANAETSEITVREAPPKIAPPRDPGAELGIHKNRKSALERELASENMELQQAKKELAKQKAANSANKDSPQTLKQLQPYKDHVAEHEKNIAVLKKKLSEME